MGWFSNLRRAASTAPSAAPSVADTETVLEARVRSRRRLIGAVVLVVIGVIGFPLVFETQPRPISVDIPIEIPRKEGLSPLAMPSPKAPASVAATGPAPIAPAPTAHPGSAPAATPSTAAASPAKSVIAQAVEEVIAPGRPPTSVSSLPVLTPAPPAPPAPPARTASVPAKAAGKLLTSAEADRAKALLEGSAPPKGDAPKEAGRFVVQVGAFAENDAARSMRLKVEKLGIKTYVQVAETPAGKRIRVRVGPYANKDEAERAKSKLTAGGFPAVLLAL